MAAAYQLWAFTQAGEQAAVLENAYDISQGKVANAAGTLSFTLPADDPKAAFITSAYEIRVRNLVKGQFEGLYKLEDSTDKWSSSGKVIVCNYAGVMVQFSDEENISYDTGATPLTPTAIVTALLALQERTPAITVGTIEPTTTFCIAVENVTLMKAFQECVAYLGGYIEVDEDRHFNWYNEPSGSPVREIRYQKNMKGVTRKRDFTSITNKLYAYGYGETGAQVTLLDAGEAHEYIEDATSQSAYGVFPRRITDKRITHPSTLLRWAQKVLAQYKDPIYSYTVDAVNLAVHPDHDYDLENLEVGQIVRVVNSDLVDPLTGLGLNVNVKIVKVTTNLSRPEEIRLELANATKSLSSLFASSADTASLVNNVAVQIGAGQVTVQGTFTVAGWASAGTTTINGANITTGTISANKLDFTPVGSSNIVASINASTEGITISAAKISISGSCTFASGYDPTSKTAKVGGTYDSASSGARVRIFPDANTGILVTDGTNEVFKALVGGTDVGDVIIGDYANNKGLKWDQSAGTFIVRGSLEAVSIASGKTLTVTGAIQSNDYASSPAAGWLLSGSGATFMDVNVRGALSVGSTIDATGTVSASGLVSSSTLRLSANISSPAARSLYTDNGLALKWRDKDGTVRTLAFL